MALNLNVTELRTFNPKGGAKTSENLTSENARKLLVDIRSQLVGRDGTIEKGYLRIHNNKEVGGSKADMLVTQGRYSGSKNEKVEAKRFVMDLIGKAYGESLSEEQLTALDTSLTNYFNASGSRFGTQSFVKLINALESASGGETFGNVKANARLGSAKHGEFPELKFKKPLAAAECGAPAAAQFTSLKGMLSTEAQEFFQHLFNPLQPGSAAQVSGAGAVGAIKPTYVLGDADGSVSRTVLAAMNCGMMKLDTEGLKTLSEVMEAETNVLYSKSGKRDFQANAEIAEKIDKLVNQATYSKGESQLVSIGDILHDRFSNNKEAMGTLIEKLHEQGAVFITGNHDVYDEVNGDGNLLKPDFESLDADTKKHWIEQEISKAKKENTYDPENPDNGQIYEDKARAFFVNLKEQNGFYGAKQLNKDASDALISKCFVNAHFDKENAILYTHNGVTLSPNSVPGFETYSTGLGAIQPSESGVVALAEAMNRTAYNPTGDFTNFRPKDGKMQSDLLGPIAKWEGRNVRFVHGHEANHGVTGNVINVNARAGGLSPVLMVID